MKQSSTPLWLDLKIDYIDENFDKVFNYVHQNNLTTKDGFYDITISLLEKRISALIQEFQLQPIIQDETLSKDKDRIKFIGRLLGLYLLSATSESKNYRTAFLLFVYVLMLLTPKSISLEFVSNALKFVFGILPKQNILEWNDIKVFYPDIVAHKLSQMMALKAGYTQSSLYEMMGTLQLQNKKLQLAATNKINMANSSTTSLSIIDGIINILSAKSERLKQSESTDIEKIKEFTSEFILAQCKVSTKLKSYKVGEELDVRLIGKSNGHLQVTSTDRAYQPVYGEVKFSQNFFFYNEQDFIDALNIDDEFPAEYIGEGTFEIKNSFMRYIKDCAFVPGDIVKAEAVMFTKTHIGWGTDNGFGVYTLNSPDEIEHGTCAEIKLKIMYKDEDGNPTGWVQGEFVRILEDEEVDFEQVKANTIAEGFIYDKDEEDIKSAPILSSEFIKTLYRLLVFYQQQCVTNPTERYQIICVCAMLATLIGKERDVEFTKFLADYLENLIRFAKSEYEEIAVPQFETEQMAESVVRRQQIVSILQAYSSTSNTELLDEIIDASGDPLLVKLATLVQSCNRLENVINRSMQNIIKREIISSLSVETEGETDLEEENGVYLGIENDRQEFKTSFFHAPQSAKEQRQHINIFKGVCAFLNTTEGGTLYIGVNDLGYVQGIESDINHLQTITYGNYKGIDGYQRYIIDEAKKLFDIDVVANIKQRPMYDNKVIALEVTPYEFGVVKLEDKAYLRVNGESVNISETAISRIESRKKHSIVKKDAKVEELSKAIRAQRCVILHNYQSSNSGTIRDRQVEVFDFTDDGSAIWCYDLQKQDVRLFNIPRIGYIEVTAKPWTNQALHKRGELDIFRMTGSHSYDICLRLNMRAKCLLLEEYPRSKDYITSEKNNSWLLTTKVFNIAGVARFYMGLANSIEIVSAPELVAYIKEYCQTYLKM